MKYLHICLLIVLVSLLSLGQLQRITIGPFSALYVHDIVLTFWIVLLSASHFSKVVSLVWKAIVSFFSNWLLVIVALFVIVGWTGAVATDIFPVWTLLYSLRLAAYLFWGWLFFKLKPVSDEWLQLGFVSSGLLLLLFGLIQYLFLPDTRFLSILGWDDHYYRLLSTQLDPNFTGLLLIITLFWIWSLPFSFWQWLIHGLSERQLRKAQQITNIVVSILLLIAISITFSRSSMVALIAGGLIYGFKFSKKAKVIGIALIAIVVGTFVVAPKPTGEGINLLRASTAYSRIATANNWLNTMQPYQLAIGRGLFVPPSSELQTPDGIEADHANLPDNLLVLLVSGLGFIGSSLFILLAVPYFKKLNLDTGSLAIFVAVISHSMFNNSLLQPFILLFILGKLIENSWQNQLVEKVKDVAAVATKKKKKK